MGLRVQSKAENSTEPRWLYGCRGLGQAPDGGGGESHRRAAARAGPGLPTASTRGSLEAGTGTRPAVMKMSAAQTGARLEQKPGRGKAQAEGPAGGPPPRRRARGAGSRSRGSQGHSQEERGRKIPWVGVLQPPGVRLLCSPTGAAPGPSEQGATPSP